MRKLLYRDFLYDILAGILLHSKLSFQKDTADHKKQLHGQG